MVFFIIYIWNSHWMGFGKRIFIKDVNLKEKFDDFITYIIIGIIIGGRLGYVIFYNLDYI